MEKTEKFTDYYGILGISSKATVSEIKIAYKKESLKWHPDKNKYNTNERMQEINEAHRILLDDNLRIIYDKKYNEVLIKATNSENGTLNNSSNQQKYSSKENKVRKKPDFKNLNLKSDNELFTIYRNAIKYSLENVYLLVKELKARFRTDNLDVITDFISKLKKR